jgi:hypothetical protein
MEESLLNKVFNDAPMTSTAAIVYGLEHTPTFTISLLHGLLFAAATDFHTRIEDQNFALQLHDLMSKCGPWQYARARKGWRPVV